MRILYTGPFRAFSVTEARRRAMIDLGHEVIGVDQVSYLDRGPLLARKAQMHSLIGPGIAAYNRDLLERAREVRADLIYVDTGSYLWSRTVNGLRKTGSTLLHYCTEDFGFRRYFFRHFFKSIQAYDVHAVSFPPSGRFLTEQGAKRVVRIEFGYDAYLHQPPRLTPEERETYDADAVFIGHWEPQTERQIAALRNAGVAVKVWGPGWRRARSLRDRHRIRPIYGESYVKALACARICLCFMSKHRGIGTGNTHSVGRTFEIPAVGGFLLAERTQDHLTYYEEGREAEFFGSSEELVSKARHYLAHGDLRAAIAARGHKRCISSGYSYHDRCRQLLETIH